LLERWERLDYGEDDGREALGPADGDAIAALLGAEEGAGFLLGSNDGKAEGSNMLEPDDGDDDLLGSDEEVGTLVGTEDSGWAPKMHLDWNLMTEQMMGTGQMMGAKRTSYCEAYPSQTSVSFPSSTEKTKSGRRE
jgi:hypothetical protein